jgi:hypothetical protein
MAVDSEMIAIALGVAAPESGSITDKQWTQWIEDAAFLIETRRAQLDVDEIDEAKLDYVIRQAVVAQVKKPDDATQVTVSVDDGATSKSYKSGKGRVTILDEWWTLLGLTEPSGAFALDMVGIGSVHLPWCSLNFGALYCSCGADIAGVPIYEDAEEYL